MQKGFIDVVDIGSSDDEGGVGAERRRPNLASLQDTPKGQNFKPNLTPASCGVKQDIQWRVFWKAGNFDVAPSKSTTFHGHLEHARVHPKFLHSNATSHKWAFGAIAELLDNAVDEICNGATFVKVDRIYNAKDNSPALLFHDNGGGMDTESLRKCMSLGYSSKKSNSTIGQYGNGFKTSTMRLGADVIVFSRATRPGRVTQSVGLLSYTFLRTTGQDDVIVPMVDFDISGHWPEPIIYGSHDEWTSNLKTILEWSPFSSKEDLMAQFEDIGPHGTKVIVYNLWLNDEGIFELSFDDDNEDILLRDETNRGNRMTKRAVELQSHISHQMRYSLRAYASILYLRKFTNFHIILRGKPVQHLNIAHELKNPKLVVYRPQVANASKEVSVETTLGFNKLAPAVSITGFNVYHKNRLIRPFWKVTGDGQSQGNSVIGVLEANFIEPAHDKQDFERSTLFLRLENKLRQMQLEYWKSYCHLLGLQSPNSRACSAPKAHPVQASPRVAANIDNQPIVGRAANLRSDMMPPGSGCRVNVRNESSVFGPVAGLATGANQEARCSDASRTSSLDRICEENIQLFMRCEEQIQRKMELKKLAEELEKEVKEAKRSCDHLSSLIELRKREKI